MLLSDFEERVIDSARGHDYSVAAYPLGHLTIPREGKLMDTKKLVVMRKEAEKAIAEMPDGDLKVKAFEVILGHLLGASGGTPRQPAPDQGEDVRPARKGKAAKSATARVLVLREEGFFKNQRSMGEVSAELAAHGWHYPLTALSGNLQGLTQRREIRRVRAKKGNKKVWLYSEP